MQFDSLAKCKTLAGSTVGSIGEAVNNVNRRHTGSLFFVCSEENLFLPFVHILCHRVQTSCRKIKMSPSSWVFSLHNPPPLLFGPRKSLNTPSLSLVILYTPSFWSRRQITKPATDRGFRGTEGFTAVTVFTQWGPHERELCMEA